MVQKHINPSGKTTGIPGPNMKHIEQIISNSAYLKWIAYYGPVYIS